MVLHEGQKYLSTEDQFVLLDFYGGGHSYAGSTLAGANLGNANASGARFDRCDLRYISFENAGLQEVQFRHCRLSGANFASSFLDKAEFIGCDLSGCVGLDDIQPSFPHAGWRPISIDIVSVIATRSNFPASFLKRCNIPDTWIEYLPSLVNSLSPIQLHSCMLSHSSVDEAFCSLLDTALRAAGVPVWFSPKDMQPGRVAREQMQDAVRVCDRLLLVISNESMKSNWVRNEIKWAARIEQETRSRVLFPISLVEFSQIKAWECWDDGSGQDLAEAVRRYHIPNYSTALDSRPKFESAVSDIVAQLKNPGLPTLPKLNRSV